MVSQFKSKINTMVTNSRKVKITCGNDEFVVKGVVFDKDGVLTGGFDLWKQIFYLYMKVASQKGLCVEKVAIDLFGVDEDPSIAPLSLCTMEEAKCLLAAAIWLMYKIDWATCRKLSQEIVEEAQRVISPEMVYSPLPGAKELFTLLSQHVPVAIATSDSRSNVEEMFKFWQVELPIIVSAEDVKRGKPFPDMLLKVSSLMGIPCEDLVVFGDSLGDVQMAHAAGAKAVAVGIRIPEADSWVQSLLDVSVEVLE